MLLGLPRSSSAPGVFAETRVDSFQTILRELVASVIQRVRGSTSSFLNTILVRVDCPMLRLWNAYHTLAIFSVIKFIVTIIVCY